MRLRTVDFVTVGRAWTQCSPLRVGPNAVRRAGRLVVAAEGGRTRRVRRPFRPACEAIVLTDGACQATLPPPSQDHPRGPGPARIGHRSGPRPRAHASELRSPACRRRECPCGEPPCGWQAGPIPSRLLMATASPDRAAATGRTLLRPRRFGPPSERRRALAVGRSAEGSRPTLLPTFAYVAKMRAMLSA